MPKLTHKSPNVHDLSRQEESGWTELEGRKVINKCDQQSEWLVEWTISGSINLTDGVREAKMRFVNKQISTISDIPTRHSIKLITQPSPCLS